MKKIGFDLGSSSIGWFLREDDNILKQGVITFKPPHLLMWAIFLLQFLLTFSFKR